MALLGLMVACQLTERVPLEQATNLAGYPLAEAIPESAFQIVDEWERVTNLGTENEDKTLVRRTQDADRRGTATAATQFSIPANRNFEMRLKLLQMNPGSGADLRIGLDPNSNLSYNYKLDIFFRLQRRYDRTSSTNSGLADRDNNGLVDNTPVTDGDYAFIRRTNSDKPNEVHWQYGIIRADGRVQIHGQGVGFNFDEDARPVVSISKATTKVQLLLLIEDGGQTPDPDPNPTPAPDPTPDPDPDPTPDPGPGSSQFALRNPANASNYNAWEYFDPQARNYDPNPVSVIINDYFRTRTKLRDDSYGGVEWSTEEPPLIAGDGQIMKSWVKLQNPNDFVSGVNFRADLETRFTLDDFGWEVYDPNIPQTRAYSFAFKLPNNFTYSTTGSGRAGTIEVDGYNWIISQWLDYSSPVTPPYAIHMRGKDLLLREKIYSNWHPIVEDVDQHFSRGEWIVFLAIVRWSRGNDGYFKLFYDWADPRNPQPTNWKEVVDLRGKATVHPQARRKVTAMFKVGGYYWLMKHARYNQIWWDDNAGVDRTMVSYFDQWRGITLNDPRFQNFSEADIKRYFELIVQD